MVHGSTTPSSSSPPRRHFSATSWQLPCLRETGHAHNSCASKRYKHTTPAILANFSSPMREFSPLFADCGEFHCLDKRSQRMSTRSPHAYDHASAGDSNRLACCTESQCPPHLRFLDFFFCEIHRLDLMLQLHPPRTTWHELDSANWAVCN